MDQNQKNNRFINFNKQFTFGALYKQWVLPNIACKRCIKTHLMSVAAGFATITKLTINRPLITFVMGLEW